nr:sulfotransferase family cytosolic 1B member 1-like [Odocoileus virginianus texanus]
MAAGSPVYMALPGSPCPSSCTSSTSGPVLTEADLKPPGQSQEQTPMDDSHTEVEIKPQLNPRGISSGLEQLEKNPSPRVVKTHLPIDLIPKSFWENNCKIIYLARNAKDVAVSFYHFDLMNNLQPFPGTWGEYLEKFLTGNVAYGSWFNHVKSWWKKKEEHPILFLFYEDMKENPKQEIKKVVQFLEKNLDDEILDKIIHHTSFEMMNSGYITDKMEKRIASEAQALGEDIHRRYVSLHWIAGDWKNYFTVAQNEKFDTIYKKEMSETELQFRTEI